MSVAVGIEPYLYGDSYELTCSRTESSPNGSDAVPLCILGTRVDTSCASLQRPSGSALSGGPRTTMWQGTSLLVTLKGKQIVFRIGRGTNYSRGVQACQRAK